MTIFIKDQSEHIINLYYVQNIVINPEDDKEVIIYKTNGESIIEKYDSSNGALTAYNNYKSLIVH